MMRYVQADGDTFIRHIYDNEPTRWDDDNFCFARRLTPEQAEKFGVSKLRPVTPPYYDPATQIRYEGDAVLVDGEWLQSWIVADMDAATKAELYAKAVDNFAQERAKKLAETDWWAIRASEPSGIPMTEDQSAYRQALRDMDDAEGFDPRNPNWPEMPA